MKGANTYEIPISLKLNKRDVAQGFSGRLYFIIGPGLGDTVNDLRILHMVLLWYSQAQPIVYADPRWHELYARDPELSACSIRYYGEGESALPVSNSRAVPFHRTFQSIVSEILQECKECPGDGYVAIGGFKLTDQLARRECSIKRKARAIGMEINPSETRPYCNISQQDFEEAINFLKRHSVKPGGYVVIAPQTWTDKLWENYEWENLIKTIREGMCLPTVVIGVHENLGFRGQMVYQAIGLRLPVVAALIAQSRCYIGLDTGPTHLAAAYNIPIVALNPQGKFPPFLIEPHSPHSWIHLTPQIYGSGRISSDSVIELVQFALRLSSPPSCPSCGSKAYVLGAQDGVILFLCRCGFLFRWCGELPSKLPDGELSYREIHSLPTSFEGLMQFKMRLSTPQVRDSIEEVITLRFEHWDSVETNPNIWLLEQSGRDIWWTWDAVYTLLSTQGWIVLESQCEPIAKNFVLNSPAWDIRIVISRNQGAVRRTITFPWGRKLLNVEAELYEQYLSWGAFRNQKELVGIGKLLSEQGNLKEGLAILGVAFKIQPEWSILRKIIYVSIKVLRHRFG